MIIAIHGRTFKEQIQEHIQTLFDELQQRHVQIVVSADLAEFLKQTPIRYQAEVYKDHRDLPPADYLFSLGGDGTLLESVTHVGSKGIPIVGINAGRLGFLATNAPADVKNLIQQIFNGYYRLESRTLVSVADDQDVFEGLNFGLNEFTVVKRDTSSMIVVHTYIDGEYLNSYWADGLIVATPTGSTGYSLSCGGPVVLPESNNFIIAPVSPHNLNVRPLIVSDDSVISFSVEGRGKNFLVSLDSRSKVIDSTVQIAVKKADFKVNLLRLHEDNFLYTLRQKLNWGLDMRN
ncbi:MAG: NAD kinase [Microscillaceae bacterium]|nr:NAD kinase [Microscillaceae bacterium]MDW8460717.1 NAD kinase [Cytophagales bacterium]